MNNENNQQNKIDDSTQQLVGTVFMFADQFADVYNPNRVEFHRMISPFYNGEKWRVKLHGWCLNNNNEWELEPSPSNRNEEFYTRCRFDTIEEAVDAYKKNSKENN